LAAEIIDQAPASDSVEPRKQRRLPALKLSLNRVNENLLRKILGVVVAPDTAKKERVHLGVVTPERSFGNPTVWLRDLSSLRIEDESAIAAA